MPYSYRMYNAHWAYHRQQCTLHAVEQYGSLYICTTYSMTNIRSGWDLNPVGLPLSFEPQSDRMSRRGQPEQGVTDRFYTSLDDGLVLANKY